MNNTPNANRLHIAVFGKCNSGKSSLVNAIANQNTALVSDKAGTTTDPVYKAMEIHPLGACVLIDTAGFDDTTELGEMRIKSAQQVIAKADIAIMVFSDTDIEYEKQWIKKLNDAKVPVLAVANKSDINDTNTLAKLIKSELKLDAIEVSAVTGQGIALLKDALVRLVPEDFEVPSITAHLCKEDDVVMLVMPQDIQAPKGRLILPQVQTIRDLLDNKCLVYCVTTDKMEKALATLKEPPKVIITDSQVFDVVYKLKPKQSVLTSFSSLFARYKGDIDEYVKGAEMIPKLTENDTVLIAEACSHTPLDGDIGRVKLPKMLKSIAGEGLKIQIVSGTDFPEDLSPYSLVIHCGGCMFNRKYILSRVQKAKNNNVPITNYGIAIAKIKGILDKIKY